MRQIKKIKKVVVTMSLLIAFVLGGCSDYFETEDNSFVSDRNHYTSTIDVISAINGLYALMQDLVDPLWVVGETRGDLVVPGRGANKDLYDVCMNQVSPTNPYADFAPFYALVNNCNGVIEGLNRLRDDNQNYTDEMLQRNLVEVKFIRGWAYLQLVKIWGAVPYTDQFVTSADQIALTEPLPVKELVRKLVDELLPLVNAYGFTSDPERKYFNYYSVRLLLSEMLLELGEYEPAYRMINAFFPVPPDPQSRLYWMGYYYTGATWVNMFAGNAYNSGKAGGWVQYIPFDSNKGAKNSLIRWTNNINGGVLAFKPATQAIRNWESQPQSEEFTLTVNPGPVYLVVANGFLGDQWRGNLRSYYIDGNDTIIYKFLIRENAVNRYTLGTDTRKEIYDDGMCFPLYRDSHLCLLYAEILNRMGRTREALQFVMGGTGRDSPGIGVRGRVWLYPLAFEPTSQQMDSLIMNEWGLETAFEGTRFFDMMRIARHSGNFEMVAERIAGKYPPAEQARVKAFFMKPENWYMPYCERATAVNPSLKKRPTLR